MLRKSVDHLEKNKIFNSKTGKVIRQKYVKNDPNLIKNQNDNNPLGDKLLRQLELKKEKNKNYFAIKHTNQIFLTNLAKGNLRYKEI